MNWLRIFSEIFQARVQLTGGIICRFLKARMTSMCRHCTSCHLVGLNVVEGSDHRRRWNVGGETGRYRWSTLPPYIHDLAGSRGFCLAYIGTVLSKVRSGVDSNQEHHLENWIEPVSTHPQVRLFSISLAHHFLSFVGQKRYPATAANNRVDQEHLKRNLYSYKSQTLFRGTKWVLKMKGRLDRCLAARILHPLVSTHELRIS